MREALQQDTDTAPLWEVFSSQADKKGDNVAVYGAAACFREIAIGASFDDPGMRGDSHDAVAVGITIRDASQPAGESKRRKIHLVSLSDSEVSLPRTGPGCPEDDTGDPPSSASSSASASSVEGGPAGDEIDEDVKLRAEELHTQMRGYWNERYDGEYKQDLIDNLSRLLFMKRKGDHPAGKDCDTAFASQEETVRAIQSVLQVRQQWLRKKSLDMRHVLNEDERGEIAKEVRGVYEQTPYQRRLQERDVRTCLQKGKAASKGSRGARQPGRGDGRGRGKGSLEELSREGKNLVKSRKRSRWCRHLQRISGTKQIWEVLTFSGFFDVPMLEQLVQKQRSDETDTTNAGPREEKRQLHKDKAEAVARYNEAWRLVRHRDDRQRRGAGQPALTRRQVELLQKWDSGELHDKRNEAVANLGHGRLRNRQGDCLDIGGSTGGLARRVLDSWEPPDYQQFLAADDLAGDEDGDSWDM